MNPNDMGLRYARVGALLTDNVRLDPDGAFLYAEVEDGTIAASVFKDVGDRVVYRDPSDELTDEIYDIWELTDSAKRWFSMSYTIVDGKFSATFQFPEQIDRKEFFSTRRRRILREKYGDKPVDYSDP